MSKVCVPGGQVPLRTLVRVSDLQIFTIIDDFARFEPPHGRAPPELNPHAELQAGNHEASSSFLSAARHPAYGLRGTGVTCRTTELALKIGEGVDDVGSLECAVS